MFRFLIPTILIGATVGLFLLYTKPFYQDISSLRVDQISYDEALNNSKILESERDKLTAKYNSFKPEDLGKIEKFLPDNVDNIRLILELESIAKPYGMTLKDVKYENANKKDIKETGKMISGAVIAGGEASSSSRKDYGIWNLEFSTVGTYANALNFMKDLENNLRIVDIVSVQFSSDTGTGVNLSTVGSYKYSFKIKTYWLKN